MDLKKMNEASNRHADRMNELSNRWADKFDRLNSEIRLYAGNGENTGFSARTCETCGSTLAGDRFTVTAIERDTPSMDAVPAEFTCSVCSDCVQYIANGELPIIEEN